MKGKDKIFNFSFILSDQKRKKEMHNFFLELKDKNRYFFLFPRFLGLCIDLFDRPSNQCFIKRKKIFPFQSAGRRDICNIRESLTTKGDPSSINSATVIFLSISVSVV